MVPLMCACYCSPMSSTFQTRIREARTVNKMTVTELAFRCSVSEQTIRSWENGRMYPRLKTLVRLAGALGTTVGTLVGDKEIAREAPSESPEKGNAG